MTLFGELGPGLPQASFFNAYLRPHLLGSGFNWQLDFTDAGGHAWLIDLWAFEPFDYAVRQARDFALRTDLLAFDRDLILRLKTEARERGRRLLWHQSIGLGRLSVRRWPAPATAWERWKCGSRASRPSPRKPGASGCYAII